MIYAIGVGRLTKDCEIKHTDNGLAIVKFSIASNEGRKVDGEWTNTAHFYDCVMFGKYGEAMQKHLTKGREFMVKGALKHNRWTSDDGVNHSKHQITVETLEFVGSKSSGNNQQNKAEPNQFEDDIPF